jgi:tRNA A37 threonylcarbamoyladenosine dehydratase
MATQIREKSMSKTLEDLTTYITFRIDSVDFVVHYYDIAQNNVGKVLHSMLAAYRNNDCSIHIEDAATGKAPFTKEDIARLDTIEEA